MKTVLLVSNRRPDEEGGRAEKFATRARLLEAEGWRVVVGYVAEPYVRNFPASLLSVLRIARREDVDVVNSVNNPFHLHLIGYLVSRLTGTPWLAELRDPIVEIPDREPGSLDARLAGLVKELVVRRADQVVWFDGIQLPDDHFECEYAHLPQERFYQLPPMGYERATFDDAEPVDYDDFTITYAGSFYDGWIEPFDFLAGLGEYVDEHGPQGLTVQFYGDWTPEYQRAAEDAGVAGVVEHHEFVPHEEIVPVLKGSDCLLYVGGDDPGNRLNLPAKTWDYVGARVPVLSIVDPSFRFADFVEEHGLGVVVPPGDPQDVAEAIDAVRSGRFVYDPEESVFEELSRERSVERFAGVLDAVVAGRTYDPDADDR